MTLRILLAIGVLALIAGAAFGAIKDAEEPTSNFPVTAPTTATNAATGTPVEEQPSVYRDKALDGPVVPLLEFTQEDYEQAKTENKIIVLLLYRSDCTSCQGESLEIEAGFEALTTTQVVGFQVDYADHDPQSPETEFAGQFNLSESNTKVIIKKGAELSRSTEVWDQAEFARRIEAALVQ